MFVMIDDRFWYFFFFWTNIDLKNGTFFFLCLLGGWVWRQTPYVQCNAMSCSLVLSQSCSLFASLYSLAQREKGEGEGKVLCKRVGSEAYQKRIVMKHEWGSQRGQLWGVVRGE